MPVMTKQGGSMPFKVLPGVNLNARTLFLVLFGLSLAPQINADYLSDLEAEVQSMGSMDGVPAEEEASNWTPDNLSDVSLHKNLNEKGFEENLKHSALGSYHVYSKLSPAYQEQVYKAYQEGAGLDELKILIRDLFNQL
jgi:membrane peptidoglycan carboxypeptidase